jgi:predicted Zn-dependent protease
VNGFDLDAAMVRAAALHEIGHLLGVGHSLSEGDIMSAEAHALELSRADLTTLRLLYVLPPGAIR